MFFVFPILSFLLMLFLSHVLLFPSGHRHAATLVEFHTTFHYNDAFRRSPQGVGGPEGGGGGVEGGGGGGGVSRDEIRLLREELKYTRETLNKLREEKQDKNKPCKLKKVPECQVRWFREFLFLSIYLN